MPLNCVLFLALCLACGARVSRQQVVEASLPHTRLCSIPEEVVRVLPSSGFSRSPEQSWAATHFDAGPDAALKDLDISSCLYWSFDPSFEDLLGPNPTIYQVGPTTTTYTYTETPAYLPGEKGKQSGLPVLPYFPTFFAAELMSTSGGRSRLVSVFLPALCTCSGFGVLRLCVYAELCLQIPTRSFSRRLRPSGAQISGKVLPTTSPGLVYQPASWSPYLLTHRLAILAVPATTRRMARVW